MCTAAYISKLIEEFSDEAITWKNFDLPKADVARVDAHHHIAGDGTTVDFLEPFALPLDASPGQFGGGEFDEPPHRFQPAHGVRKILCRPFLLKHEQLHLHIIAGMAQVAQRGERP